MVNGFTLQSCTWAKFLLFCAPSSRFFFNFNSESLCRSHFEKYWQSYFVLGFCKLRILVFDWKTAGYVYIVVLSFSGVLLDSSRQWVQNTCSESQGQRPTWCLLHCRSLNLQPGSTRKNGHFSVWTHWIRSNNQSRDRNRGWKRTITKQLFCLLSLFSKVHFCVYLIFDVIQPRDESGMLPFDEQHER